MKITNYANIASRYDRNKLRYDFPKDENIEKLYIAKSSQLRVLDLACGTGNYLKKQIEEFRGYSISWVSVDKSPEMLAIANTKGIRAELIEGDAGQLPLPGNSVDYVKIRFAFHHFTDKEKAVSEVSRVLKRGGAVNILNLSHEYMKHSWIYRYFPSAQAIDQERFPSALQIYNWFVAYGFDTAVSIQTTIRKHPYNELLEEVENRDMSQLNLISDSDYRKGLEKIRQDAQTGDHLVCDDSFLNVYAVKTHIG